MTNIVMTVRNRLTLTDQSIVSLYTHTPRDMFTLTLIDDGSDPEFYVGYAYGNTVLRLDDSKHILGAIKNLGVYWSEHHFGRGDYLYLSDNDVYFTEGWLEKLISAYEESKQERVLILGGQNHPYHQPESRINYPTRERIHTYSALAGTSMLMKWSTWDKFGPLVETGAPGVCQSEDAALCAKIREAGGKVGAIWPHVVLDTGITQTDGKPSPGAETKKRVEGVIYE